jgi:hypothetical protein
VTTLKDVVGVLLLAFLLPVWMALGVGAVVVVVARQLYWWARGNTSVASRVMEFRGPERVPAVDAPAGRDIQKGSGLAHEHVLGWNR